MLELIAPSLCVGCGGEAGRARPLCVECRAALRPAPVRLPAGARAVFAYDGPAGAMVRTLKFHGRIAVADAMAAQIVANAAAELLADGALVPVPAHPRHRRRRGFNHARVLAEALARRSGLRVCDCLVRDGEARPQVGRGRRARLAGVSGRIGLRGTLELPRRALVVDDVITTGATITACCSALRAAGVAEISALAYAATEGR